jgi:hypothetical protein
MPSSGAISNKNIQPDSESAALPQEYGVTMAALMPRDPNWMFVYWEITPNSKARLARERGHDIFEKGRHKAEASPQTARADHAQRRRRREDFAAV